MVLRSTVVINLLFFFLVSNDDNIMDDSSSQNISYDVSKLVDFPGFNVPAPRGMRDVSLTVYIGILIHCSVFVWFPESKTENSSAFYPAIISIFGNRSNLYFFFFVCRSS